MKYTKNYNFKKPEPYDTRNINDINESFDLVDAKLKETQDKNVNLDETFKQLVIDKGNNNAEIVAARRDKFNNKTYNSVPDRLDDFSGKLAQVANQVVDVDIESYSMLANGSDYSAALDYIISNIADNINRFVIHFNKNKVYVINGNINKRFITLMGGATINGTLNIGLSDAEVANTASWYDTFMGCILQDLSFVPNNSWNSATDNTSQGLRFKNARDVIIRGCTFKNMVYPIKFLTREKAKSGHISRVYITECNFSTYRTTYMGKKLVIPHLMEYSNMGI